MATNSFGFRSVSSRSMRSSNRQIQIGVTEMGEPIKINFKNHDALLDHIKKRIEFGNSIRNQQVDKFEIIDKEVYGYLQLDQEDQQRAKDNKLGKGIKPTDVKLSLIWAQLDEALTYMANVLAPDEALYNAIAPVEQQSQAKAFAALMNKHGDYFGHYIQLLKFIFDCLKYNFGGYTTNWEKVFGNRIISGQAGAMEVARQMVFQGNKLRAFDPYNLVYDISCHPCDLNLGGEFFATFEVVSEFDFKRREENGEIFGFTDYVDGTKPQIEYYKKKPVIRGSNLPQVATDWMDVFSLGEFSDSNIEGYEEMKYTGWLRSSNYKLPTKEKGKYEIWEFTVANNMHICNARRLNNAHGMLPINIGMPNDDHFLWQTKAHAEHLIPYQSFGSFQMNVAQRAARKALIGLSVFNSRYFPQLANTEVDLAGGKIGAETHGNDDVDLRKHFLQFTDVPDTSRNMETIDQMDSLMQKVMPTDMLRQVAGLERATQYQAAATVQGSNRRNLKIAKILYIQAMARGNHQQMYNIMQYQETMQLLTPEGELVDVNPTEFREMQLEFLISEGLRGLDKLAFQMEIKEMLNAIIQSQQALQQIDVVKIINYYTSLIGDHTDFSQFRVQSPIDNLSPEEKNLAFQLLQQYLQQQQGGAAGGQPQVVGGTAA